MDKETLTVVVTKDHINRGDRYSSSTCPVALSLIDSGFLSVKVGRTTMSVDYELYDISSDVTEFVVKFDRGYVVDPIKFEAIKRD